MIERRTDATKRERFEALRARLGERLRRACEGMPQREFDRLVAQMTRVELKYESWTGMPEV